MGSTTSHRGDPGTPQRVAIVTGEDELGRATDALDTAASILGIDRRSLPYARVDCVERGGEFLLMELELIEPYLNLGVAEGAVERFATAIQTAIAPG